MTRLKVYVSWPCAKWALGLRATDFGLQASGVGPGGPETLYLLDLSFQLGFLGEGVYRQFDEKYNHLLAGLQKLLSLSAIDILARNQKSVAQARRRKPGAGSLKPNLLQ